MALSVSTEQKNTVKSLFTRKSEIEVREIKVTVQQWRRDHKDHDEHILVLIREPLRCFSLHKILSAAPSISPMLALQTRYEDIISREKKDVVKVNCSDAIRCRTTSAQVRLTYQAFTETLSAGTSISSYLLIFVRNIFAFKILNPYLVIFGSSTGHET